MSGEPPALVSRPMKFPYTFTAQIAQFPYKFYWKYSWQFRFYAYAVVASLPIFYQIHKLSNSPENKAAYAEMRRKEAAEHHH
ncbi:uncharacterized protein LOC124413957 [Diprion similis]|uniref:uncharacterized protein LOC124413957 n=1 Tax=Diprion similis TaxID=362088 RepID=UPI001EF903F0|nr:uncharacterized protein LOC124413957 [Diprion similis]